MWCEKILKSVIQQVNKIGNWALSEPFGPARQKGNGVWIAQISAKHRSPCRWNEGACALTIWQRLRKISCKYAFPPSLSPSTVYTITGSSGIYNGMIYII